ncbi:MAG: carboxypeptidase regulatory-like domain-containing protein, partial [Thermoanaerobaculales bacterium]|nr:carboxypeptidase regulatory-like domain-containing protein [Thermoanaerobaculales bacterium]
MVRRVFGILCIVVLLASAVGYAATTGRMKGKVSDNDGLALPGVTVQISSVNLIGGPQVAISGIDGGFTFNMLPIGMYTVSVSLSGFSPATGEVRVQLDRLATVEFLLVPEQFGGEIEVLAEVPIVDTAQVNTQQVFDQDFLQNAAIGASGRDYLSIIGQVAGVAGDANASVFGGMQTDNAFLIDGLNTTDPVTGTFGTNFNYDAIQEVSFQTGGFEAEFGQATGGIINLVTKSGGNEFSGSFDVRFRDQSFIESGEHFDPDEEVSSFRDVSATLGGPILRDKLWFFVSGEDVKTEIRWEGTHFPRVYEGQNYIAKTTWQMADSHRAVFKYSTDPAEIPGANMSQFVLESAKYTQKQGGDIWQAEFNSVLSESVLLNAKLGIVRGLIEGGPSSNPDTWSTHWNEDTGISSHNYGSTFADDRDRDEFGMHLSWFLDDFAGSHEFKFGVEYNDLYFGSVNYPNGGAWIDDVEEEINYADLNGDGYFNHLVTIKEPEEDARNKENSYGDITTFFVQDSWRPMANLTVKPGLRFDNIGLSNHVGDDIADMDRWQPRFGVAWDIGGNARYVLRASWGRFMDPTALSIPSFASGIP